jgi:hypothetical protein
MHSTGYALSRLLYQLKSQHFLDQFLFESVVTKSVSDGCEKVLVVSGWQIIG